MSLHNFARPDHRRSRLVLGVAAIGAALAATALYNIRAARRAEEENPPRGSFLSVESVLLHRLDTGGDLPALVFLHGNGASSADADLSGLLAALRPHHRVIAFDRPGFGYSERPTDRSWTPEAQADLFVAALDRLGIGRFTLIGHSFGGLVALALALRHPARVEKLVVVGGYAFATPRLDAALMSMPAVPGIGHVLRHTISPLMTRALLPHMVETIFAPKPVPTRFWRDFPIALSSRPSQVTASAEEAAMMITAADRLSPHYGALSMPVEVIAGDGDQVVDPDQARRLADAVPGAGLTIVPGCGHMVHWFVPDMIAKKVAVGGMKIRAPERTAELAESIQG